jgi:hypothetical protein
MSSLLGTPQHLLTNEMEKGNTFSCDSSIFVLPQMSKVFLFLFHQEVSFVVNISYCSSFFQVVLNCQFEDFSIVLTKSKYSLSLQILHL